MNNCQSIKCKKKAEFVITDLLETDMYVSETYACEKHLGELIGHFAPFKNPTNAEEVWEVRLTEESP